MVVLKFIGSNEIIGVSSSCRFWGVGEDVYHGSLHFFRSSAWFLKAIVFRWAKFILSQNVIIRTQGRSVLLEDDTHIPKDGRRMPSIVTLDQHSET
jgi:hypothetical protein